MEKSAPAVVPLSAVRAGSRTTELSFLVPGGNSFDLTQDFAPGMEACRQIEGLAYAIGMLTALANEKRVRTSGNEKAVYVLQVADDPISKIGVSANPVMRLAELQGAHYRELFLYAVVFCPKRNGVAIEQEVLNRASADGNRLMGEWIADEPGNVLRSVFEVARDKRLPICDGQTFVSNMIERTKALYHKREDWRQMEHRLRRRYG